MGIQPALVPRYYFFLVPQGIDVYEVSGPRWFRGMIFFLALVNDYIFFCSCVVKKKRPGYHIFFLLLRREKKNVQDW